MTYSFVVHTGPDHVAMYFLGGLAFSFPVGSRSGLDVWYRLLTGFRVGREGLVGWLLACLTFKQHATVSQGRICSDNFTCCHTETEVAHQTFYFIQSQYTGNGPISPSADPTMPGAWQGSHWSANFSSHWYDLTPEKSRRKRDWNPGSSAPKADAFSRPARRWEGGREGERSGRRVCNPSSASLE